ncbi:MAG: prepilin-type N-terminal cleavage/methylation domain-containing protein [Candidatus Omnitrophota bacterium]|jgi:prepilin-type N-terminal cleavage/methylation domain-containing protein
MKSSSYTLVEIIISLVIIGILMTFGVPLYLNVIENSRAQICESNLKALRTALDIYVMEHDKFPASLSLLPQEYIREAYKRQMKEKGAWQIELAYFILQGREKGVAYAHEGGIIPNANFLKNDIAKGNLNIITCPMDREGTPAQGGYSYGVNGALADMSYADYKALAGSTPLIADCDSATFTGPGQFAARHKRYRIYPRYYYQVITKDGTLLTNLYETVQDISPVFLSGYH